MSLMAVFSCAAIIGFRSGMCCDSVSRVEGDSLQELISYRGSLRLIWLDAVEPFGGPGNWRRAAWFGRNLHWSQDGFHLLVPWWGIGLASGLAFLVMRGDWRWRMGLKTAFVWIGFSAVVLGLWTVQGRALSTPASPQRSHLTANGSR